MTEPTTEPTIGARVVVTPRRTIGRVDPMLFGTLIENLYGCITGGVHDPDSPSADHDGFRRDVIDAAREMGVSNVRFPGGGFAAHYHWADGVGPAAERPLTRYRANDQYPASNAFGTDEYIRWCRTIGAEPFICVNMGSGTAEEAAAWVEYCNGEPGSRWSDLRVANGSPQPYGVRLWGLGNEISAPWELGHTKTATEYVARAHDFALAMRHADPSIALVAAGAHFPIDFPERNWNRHVLDAMHDIVDHLSLHHYIGHDYKDDITREWQALGVREAHRVLTGYLRLLDDALTFVADDIRLIAHERPGARRITIALSEYNPWYKTNFSDDSQLTERYPLADGLLVGGYFAMFFRHADHLTIANMAQLVNTLPAIVVRRGGVGAYRQSISHVQQLLLPNRDAVSVDCWTDSPAFPSRYGPPTPWIDVAATVRGDRLLLTVVNHHPDVAARIDLAVVGLDATPCSMRFVGGGDLDDANSFDEPDRITIVTAPTPAPGAVLVPRASVTLIEFAMQP